MEEWEVDLVNGNKIVTIKEESTVVVNQDEEDEMFRDKFFLVYETYRGQHREIQKEDIPNIIQMLNDMYENSI